MGRLRSLRHPAIWWGMIPVIHPMLFAIGHGHIEAMQGDTTHGYD